MAGALTNRCARDEPDGAPRHQHAAFRLENRPAGRTALDLRPPRPDLRGRQAFVPNTDPLEGRERRHCQRILAA
jgi:hypothetical protein